MPSCARANGLRSLPLHKTAQNQIWLEVVQIALDLLAWMPNARPDRRNPQAGAPPHDAPPPPPPSSSRPPAVGTYDSRATGHGPTSSPARSSDSTPSQIPADQQTPAPTNLKHPAG